MPVCCGKMWLKILVWLLNFPFFPPLLCLHLLWRLSHTVSRVRCALPPTSHLPTVHWPRRPAADWDICVSADDRYTHTRSHQFTHFIESQVLACWMSDQRYDGMGTLVLSKHIKNSSSVFGETLILYFHESTWCAIAVTSAGQQRRFSCARVQQLQGRW